MREAATIEVKGLKCDAEGCNYHNDDIESTDYEQYIDAPCPDCGANLLTQADYDAVQEIFEVTKMLNEMFPPGTLPEDEPIVSMSINMDGSGIPQLGDVKIEDEHILDEDLDTRL